MKYVLRNFDNKALCEEEGFTVTHAGHCGSCSNLQVRSQNSVKVGLNERPKGSQIYIHNRELLNHVADLTRTLLHSGTNL